MMSLDASAVIFIAAIIAGTLGAASGLGGGIIIIPALTLLLHVNIRVAIVASLVSVIATSSSSAIHYVSSQLVNLRAAMLLEIATVAGALTGAAVIADIPIKLIYVLFGATLIASCLGMLSASYEERTNTKSDGLADALGLAGVMPASSGRTKKYSLSRTRLGLALMYLAGILSSLLGIGSGSITVPTLHVGMRMPLRASVATSSFMIGVTAAAGAAVYIVHGYLNPVLTAIVVLGVVLGAFIGSRLAGNSRVQMVRYLVMVLLLVTSVEMLAQATMP